MFPASSRIVDGKMSQGRRPDQGARRYRDGRPWRHRRRDPQGRAANGRSCATARTIAASPPPPNGADRPRRRPRAAEDHRRSDRHAGLRHHQQLRRRRHALGHLCDGRGELPRLLHRRTARRPSRRPPTTSASASRRAPTTGRTSTTASTSPRSRTSPTASAGSSSSIRSTRPRSRRSAPRSAASSTRAPTSIVATDGRVVLYFGDDERFDYVYKFVTAGPSTRTTARPTWTSSTRARSTSRSSTTTARATGCRWSMARAADRGQRLHHPGRRPDRDPARRRPARRDQDGPARGLPDQRRNGKVYVCYQQHQAARPTRSTLPIRAPRTSSATSSRSPRPAAISPATDGKWEVLLKCGDPSVAEVGATFSTATTKNGWFGMPDNCAIDAAGRLWVSTDGNNDRRPPAVPTASGRSIPKVRPAAPRSCSTACRSAPKCAARFSPRTTRPSSSPCSTRPTAATTGTASAVPPTTRTFRPAGPTSTTMPARPSVVAITRQGGGRIG